MQIDTFQQGSARKTNMQEQSAGVESTVNTIGFDTSACKYPPPDGARMPLTMTQERGEDLSVPLQVSLNPKPLNP